MASVFNVLKKAARAHMGQSIPIVASLVVTDRLPPGYHGAPPQAPLPDPTTEELIAVIDRLAEAGALKIILSGGEPMLREDLGRIIDHAVSLKLEVILRTTGHGDFEKIHQLKNLFWLNVELHGDRNLHEQVRGPGTYDIAVSAIEAAKKTGVQVIATSFACKGIVESVKELLDTASSLGIKVAFQPVSDKTQSKGCAPLPPEEQKRFFSSLLKMKKAGAPIKNLRRALKYFAGDCSMPLCWGGRAFCRIETGPNVLVCEHHRASRVPWNPKEPLSKALDRLDTSGCRQCLTSENVSINSAMEIRISALFDILAET